MLQNIIMYSLKQFFKYDTCTFIWNDALNTVAGCLKVNTLQKLRLRKNWTQQLL